MIWPFAVGGICLALVVADEVRRSAQRRCPACNKRFFKLVEARCNQGIEDGKRVAGMLSKFECRGCGAVRFTDRGSGYLTADELTAKNARFVSGHDLYDAVSPHERR